MRTLANGLRGTAKALSMAAALALALIEPTWASVTYRFAGVVTDVPAQLVGGGIAVGDPVNMSFTLGASVPDIDPAPSVGRWAGAIASWNVTIGSFALSGADGDVYVCDSPIPGQPNCGSANNYPFFSDPVGPVTYIGKDAVRFVGLDPTSPPLVINGFAQNCAGDPSAQCANANVLDDSALALAGTGIPGVLDPLSFNSSTNNGRIPFSIGNILYSVTPVAVAEPGMLGLLAAGFAGLATLRRRRA